MIKIHERKLKAKGPFLKQNYLTDNKVRKLFANAGNFLSEAFAQHKPIKRKENFTDILKKLENHHQTLQWVIHKNSALCEV